MKDIECSLDSRKVAKQEVQQVFDSSIQIEAMFFDNRNHDNRFRAKKKEYDKKYYKVPNITGQKKGNTQSLKSNNDV